MTVTMERYLDVPPNTSKLKRHKCVLCEASYDQLTDLQVHTYVHIPEEMVEDEWVDNNSLLDYKGKYASYKEMIIEGKGPDPLSAVMPVMRHECVLCEVAFDRLEDLQAHSYEHLPSKVCRLMELNDSKFEDLSLGDASDVSVVFVKKLPHMCVLCDAGFDLIEDLQFHSYEHLPESASRPQCAECGGTFSCSTNLNRHRHLHKEKIHKCHLCGAVFALRSKLTKHLETHSNIRPFVCEECGEAFARKATLKIHASRRHVERRFRCDECESMFVTNDEFQKHVKSQHVKSYMCNVCYCKFRSKKALADHRIVHADKKFACEECKAAFCTSDDLLNHIKSQHIVKIYRCKTCNSRFPAKEDLAKHTCTARPKDSLPKEKSGVLLKKLKKVVKKKHADSTNEPCTSDELYALNNQSVSSGKPQDLSKLSENDNEFNCGKISSSSSDELTQHNTLHTKRKLYNCKECGASFQQRSYLTIHMRVHAGQKPFKCKICRSGFIHSGALRKHMSTHRSDT